MMDILIAIGKFVIYIFAGLFGYIFAQVVITLIQSLQYGQFNRFNCISCNWMKGKKYFKPLTKEQQTWQDFLTKEI
jgi:glycerol uptake facilitator-like aquaporin